MTDAEFELGLKLLLTEFEESDQLFAAERTHFKQVNREQNIQLAIGRLKIDSARAALEAQIAARRARDETT